MKVRVYYRPFTVVWLSLIVALLLLLAGNTVYDPARSALTIAATVYGLSFLAAFALSLRAVVAEGSLIFQSNERLLIVAPHQDDCVLMAGGLGLRNQRLGGETHIVYLTQSDDRAKAAQRRSEAINAWKLGGVPERNLRHWSLLRKRGPVSREDVHRTAAELQKIVDELRPSLICVPLFEGGHLHHDITHHVVTRLLRLPTNARIFQAPEYSPYCSIWRTPHKALSHLTRFSFLGLVSYYPMAEGVGRGSILSIRLTPEELDLKRRMLREFRSQHGDSLAQNHGYPDRFIPWCESEYRAAPFAFRGSFPWWVARLTAVLPAMIVGRLFPGDHCTFGLNYGITNLDEILAVRG